jgi:hypothetical protein
MTAANGFNEEFEKYTDGWADMMITIWKEKMSAYDIHDTGALQQSLRSEIVRQSGGNTAKISHFYLLYGEYVNRGVGKGYKRGNPGDLGFTPKRQPKPWLAGKYWYSKRKLLAVMIEKTGEVYLESIKRVLTI